MKSVVAILPAYNREGNIEGLVEEVKKHVSNVIVISDGSTDNTADFARKSGAIAPEPVPKRGKGNAVIRGIEISKSLNPDIIILMDSDSQHDPKEIPDIIEPIINNQADMVIGSRFLGIMHTSSLNKLGNHILNVLHFLLTFKWITDAESGFRAFRADKLYSLDLRATHYEIESETLLEAIKHRFKIEEIPIKILKKEKGINSSDGFKIFGFVIKKRIRDILQ